MNKKVEKTEKRSIQRDPDFALGKENYVLMLVGIGIIALGFILMVGDTDIYDFRKTVLAPIITVGGFVFEIYAIMKMPKDK